MRQLLAAGGLIAIMALLIGGEVWQRSRLVPTGEPDALTPRWPNTAGKPGLLRPLPHDAAVKEIMRETRRVATELRDAYPGDPRALCLRGQVEFKFGNMQQAVGDWVRCIESAPKFLEAYAHLATDALRKGDD